MTIDLMKFSSGSQITDLHHPEACFTNAADSFFLKAVKDAFSFRSSLEERGRFLVSEYKKAGHIPRVVTFTEPKYPQKGWSWRQTGVKVNCAFYKNYIIYIMF